MEKMYKSIRNLLSLYFSEEIIMKIISNIESLNGQVDNYFYQITQENQKVKFEFACLIGNYLYDLNATPNNINAYHINLSKIIFVNVIDEGNKYTIGFELGGFNFGYTATNQKNIENLKEFSTYIVNAVAGGWKNDR